MKKGRFLTLAFETSCDETSVAVVADGREVLSNVISSQIDVHRVFGGVVPEIASRHHLTNINSVYQEAMDNAGISLQDVDLIGVTCGPGLVGALLIGVAHAKAMAFAAQKPLLGVHHIQGHIAANLIEYKDLEPPFLALVVSGGHTHLIQVEEYTKYKILGRTRDDAAGEAFDKIARVLGLGYPGGPAIDKAAKEGDPHSVEFKRVMLEKGSLDFSFSGLKTAVLNHINTAKLKGQEIPAADIAAAFQLSVVDVLVEKAMQALQITGSDKLVLAGGVAANTLLREQLLLACEKRQIRLFSPSPVLCTDNAAMVACAAHYRYQAGYRSDFLLDAYATLDIESQY